MLQEEQEVLQEVSSQIQEFNQNRLSFKERDVTAIPDCDEEKTSFQGELLRVFSDQLYV